jgi:predicted nucleic acid-binding protein
MQLIVADSGPLIALAVADCLPLTLKHYELLVPQAVLDECTQDSYAPGAAVIAECAKQANLRIIVEADIAPLDAAYAMGLGSGEQAVLSYAAMHQHVALIDERKARGIAQRLGVKLIGSATVLLALKAAGKLRNVQPALQAWAAHGYFISKQLEANILNMAGE